MSTEDGRGEYAAEPAEGPRDEERDAEQGAGREPSDERDGGDDQDGDEGRVRPVEPPD